MRNTIEKHNAPLKTITEQMLDAMYCGAIYIERQNKIDINESVFSIDKNAKFSVKINFLR